MIKEHFLVSGMSDNVDEKLSAFVQEVAQELGEDSPSGMRRLHCRIANSSHFL